jgi:hypothetical protein
MDSWAGGPYHESNCAEKGACHDAGSEGSPAFSKFAITQQTVTQFVVLQPFDMKS